MTNEDGTVVETTEEEVATPATEETEEEVATPAVDAEIETSNEDAAV